MKQYLKRLVRKSVSKLVGVEDLSNLLDRLKQLTESFDSLNSRMLLNEVASTSQGVQQLLSQAHRGRPGGNDALGRILESGFRCFSQNDEDGVLLHIFSVAGTTNKKVVEIGAGDGVECNAANLIINHGWRGLLFDGDERNIAVGKSFYSRCRDTFFFPPLMVHAWITAENVNELVATNNFAGDIDLLSVDMDGMDYWVWKALTCIRPRVVVLEFNARWGPYASVTTPYCPDFRLNWDHQSWLTTGASLGAFVKLGRERGYRLVGTHRGGVNALFLRSDTGIDRFPEVTPLECFQRVPRLSIWRPEWIPKREECPECHNVVEV